MALHEKLFGGVLAGVLGLVAMVGSSAESEASGYSSLCQSIPGVCEYAPPTAPVLRANVCFDGQSIKLKGAAPCPLGAKPFFVETGEVIDPLVGLVQPYIALPDACALGYCVPQDINAAPGQPGVMCCDPSNGGCYETEALCPPDKIAVWCDDGETPEMGNNGEWECHED